MEHTIPSEIAAALEESRRRSRRAASRYRVSAADRFYRVLEMTEDGFVIEAEAPPHLRGFVDICEGDERVFRRLVICVSAGAGLVRYEFKRESPNRAVAADHVSPERAGLLTPPSSRRTGAR
ncbi:MAG: hypothetical protein ACFBRM_09010 [Pikeienuella sp.]